VHEVKGRLGRASEFTLWFHLDSINSEMLKDCTWCRSGADKLQRKKSEQLFLLRIYRLHTCIQSHLSKIKGFSCLAHVDTGLLQRFRQHSGFCLNLVPSSGLCQNWLGRSPSKNPTVRICSSDIKVKINVRFPNQDAESCSVIKISLCPTQKWNDFILQEVRNLSVPWKTIPIDDKKIRKDKNKNIEAKLDSHQIKVE
jgi:hypothetical protein